MDFSWTASGKTLSYLRCCLGARGLDSLALGHNYGTRKFNLVMSVCRSVPCWRRDRDARGGGQWAVGNANPGATAAWWCGCCCTGHIKVWMHHGQSALWPQSALVLISPTFPCLLSLHFCLGTFVTGVPDQGQKCCSSRRHNLPPSSSVAGTHGWSSVACAITPGKGDAQ